MVEAAVQGLTPKRVARLEVARPVPGELENPAEQVQEAVSGLGLAAVAEDWPGWGDSVRARY
jgi:hypothetical protein